MPLRGVSVAAAAAVLVVLLLAVLPAEAGSAFNPVPMTIAQPIDHFAPNSAQFNQAYWLDDSHVKDTKSAKKLVVVIVYISSLAYPQTDLKQQLLVDLAEERDAYLVEVQTRYSGQSIPANFTYATDQLQTYNAPQILADFVSLAAFFPALLSAEEVQVVWVGSYWSGNFAAWMRAQFPAYASAAIAVGAPVVAAAEFPDYDSFYEHQLSSTCAGQIITAVQDVDKALQSGPQPQLLQQFGAPENMANGQFVFVLKSLLETALSTSVKTVCGTFQASKDNLVSAYATVIAQALAATGTGFMEWDLALDYADSAGQDFRPDYFMQCTQLGQFETAGNSQLSSSFLTLDWYLGVCNTLFGEQLQPNTAATNAYFGGKNFAGSKVVFLNAAGDPSLSLAITGKAPSGNAVVHSKAAVESYALLGSGKAYRSAQSETRKQIASWLEADVKDRHHSDHDSLTKAIVISCVLLGLLLFVLFLIVMTIFIRWRLRKSLGYSSLSTTGDSRSGGSVQEWGTR